jgi:hypothetical protein
MSELKLLRRLTRRPRLRLFVEPDPSPQLVRVENRPAMVYSVHVVNRGGQTARGCTAMLERIEYWNGAQWLRHPGFGLALQLPWRAVGARSQIDLASGAVSDGLPLVMAFRGERLVRIVTPLRISSGILLEYPPGEYRLTVRVRAEGKPESAVVGRIQVRYDGEWDRIRIRHAR